MCGLSDEPAKASLTLIAEHNVGAARLSVDNAGGSITLTTGDDLLKGEDPAFIKIDTEGFEVRVVRGLAETLTRHDPVLFIEVEDENKAQIDQYLEKLSYRPVESFKRYEGVTNFVYTKV